MDPRHDHPTTTCPTCGERHCPDCGRNPEGECCFCQHNRALDSWCGDDEGDE